MTATAAQKVTDWDAAVVRAMTRRLEALHILRENLNAGYYAWGMTPMDMPLEVDWLIKIAEYDAVWNLRQIQRSYEQDEDSTDS